MGLIKKFKRLKEKYHLWNIKINDYENEINTGIDHIGIGINNQDTEVLHEYTKE